MARVQVTDETWAAFKAAAGETPISELLGRLVTRHVHHDQARRAEHDAIDGCELVEALERGRELQNDLARMVERLERRLDRGQSPGEFH